MGVGAFEGRITDRASEREREGGEKVGVGVFCESGPGQSWRPSARKEGGRGGVKEGGGQKGK